MRAPTRSTDGVIYALMLALALVFMGVAVWSGTDDDWGDSPANTHRSGVVPSHGSCSASAVVPATVVRQKSAATPSRISCSR